jgi:hypothetical protein
MRVPRSTQASHRFDDDAEDIEKGMLAPRMSKSGLRSKILQKPSHGHKDFARKLLVRYCASHGDGADERAIRHDCPRSCSVLVILARVTNRVREPLKAL